MLDNQTIFTIFERLAANNHNPKTELNYSTPFELLIAVILSAQATDVSVNLVTNKLFTVANTPQQFINLGLEKLESHIKTIGLYKNKAKNILKTCEILVDKYSHARFNIPENFEELTQLAGVGRKIANVVLNIIFNQPTIAVDTHVFRTSKRIGLSNGTNEVKVEHDLVEKVPDEFKINAHHYLILLGRYVCTARKPKCESCIIYDLCLKNI